ncbi:hypothetical protein PV396_04835 [Streptomyces sp. ME02-8801-2C]|uniref:hypothetical protein n=1 Tax=Streptomyces sp. ME02-8801-2C TaxID=3028680 RepID=UPI0029AEE0B1|nr:hypothetical protein [Streptomyces sp. ME02-8801-2C]MDX3451279.1 hypothetical protein [Streptomyces sp. ME02-8801-2C]
MPRRVQRTAETLFEDLSRAGLVDFGDPQVALEDQHRVDVLDERQNVVSGHRLAVAGEY